MAVERIREFTIDLGELIKTRLESFADSQERIRAFREAEFQRNVVDNDLSFQDQLDYRQTELKEEKAKIYPDIAFGEALETKITELRKMVRQRRFRDKYFDFLGEMAMGRKGLEDHLQFLESEYENTLDSDTRDTIQEQVIKIKESLRTQKESIFASQIDFWEKDKTQDSLQKAIDAIKKRLNDPNIYKQPELLNSFQLQLRSLEKASLETNIEDKMNAFVMDFLKTDADYPSMKKLNGFAAFQNTSSTDVPVNIGGVRYNSESEFWGTTLNDYVQNNFAKEFTAENKNKFIRTYNQLGIIPQDSLNEFKNLISDIENNPVLAPFASVITNSIQTAAADILELKGKEWEGIYALDEKFIGTSEYNNLIKEMESIQEFFGGYYSTTPSIITIQNKLGSYKAGISASIRETCAGLVSDGAYATLAECIAAIGPVAEVELPKETYVEKTPMEIAQAEVKAGEEAPEIYEKKKKVEELKEEVEEVKEKVETAEEKRARAYAESKGFTRNFWMTIGGKRTYFRKEEDRWIRDVERQEKYEKEVGVTPEVEVPEVKAPEVTTHTVASGQTLWGIAKQYGYKPTTERQVMDWAKEWGYVGKAEELPVGFKLKIPKK